MLTAQETIALLACVIARQELDIQRLTAELASMKPDDTKTPTPDVSR